MSPVLFSIYMKILGEVSWKLGLGHHRYVDDMQLHIGFPKDHRETVEIRNQCLEAVCSWMRTNKMKLNPNQMEVLLVGGRIDPRSEVWIGSHSL